MVKIIISLLLAMGLFVVLPACSKADQSTETLEDKKFAILADDYLDNFYLPTFPTIATQLGIHKFDGSVEDYSITAIKKNINALKKYEKQISEFPEKGLSQYVRGDRQLVLNTIKSQLLTLETIRPWEKNPDIYSSGITYSAFVIISRKYASDEERIKSLILREKQMPQVLKEAKINLKNPPKIYVEIALEQLPGIINFFEKDVLNTFSTLSEGNLKQEFLTTNSQVVKALQDYQQWLQHDLLPKANGEFRIGVEAYRKKLLFDEMVDTPLDKLLEIDLADMRKNQQEFTRIAKELAPNKSAKEVLLEMTSNHPPADQVLESFKATFDGLIKFIHDKDIITIPSEVRPILEESPPFLRAMSLASMDTPGPFEKVAKEAYFNVTLPESDWDKTKISEFLRHFNYPAISSISIHETYPGHYVQFLWMHEVQGRVRKILGALSNAEGWAHYCEQMMLDEGFGDVGVGAKDVREAKLLRLGQLHEALLRNARFIVGIKMHTGKMTFDQAVDFFMDEAYFPQPGAMLEAKRGTMDPTYLYYTLGKLEILKLRADLQAKQGATFNLKQFHDDFMRQGYPPIKIVREALLHDESPTI